ncbi:MAG: 23S rRNA (adenine(2503)-C(2))-methyltransferase RlmN [Bacteroidales bacterium]|jgi:23S rRNA (adenine2503-C2)-methyltransferase|nr:23S rRNA (adenine(2503)-C(2))-methyltransferase RlmN [Bacteroidales bacterium]
MTNDIRPDIRTLSREEIRQGLAQHDDKKFRVRQIYEWLWMNACISFDEMTNIPSPTREFLKTNFTFYTAIAEAEQKSKDGTIKVGFRLYDRSLIEGVLIPSEDRYTACISSQVGCILGCKFCATGNGGFTRNLTVGEIFDQVVYLSKLAGYIRKPSDVNLNQLSVIRHSLSNIVFMGMGEPFLNYNQVKKSIEKITSGESLGMSPQRITVSSIGIPKMIRTMADDNPKYLFAISLHAANDEKRNQIIPFNLNHPLSEIISALKYYHLKTKKRITIEYILFAGFNDSLADAHELALFCRNFPVKINLIEYNPVKETDFIGSDPSVTRAFVNFLEKRNLVVNVRKSRGKDIDAACGQLTTNLLKSN